ncbi:MAG: hypothetical protein HZB47_06560 [Nitrosomonadales bacterium]|nr:hypothetical protein [Nitrosomonadales bacterium]
MKQHAGRTANLLVVAMAVGSGAAYAEEDRYFELGVGYEYSSGNYGTASTTDIVTIPVTAYYETGPWSLKLTVPYLRLTGDGSVVSGGRRAGMHAGTATVSTTRTTQSGLGDVVMMLTRNLVAGEAGDSGVDLSGRVKFGTASTALGTGQNDYAMQLSAYRDFSGFTPGIMFGYEVLGSTTQLPLNNVYYGSVGAGYAFGDRAGIGAEYKYAQQASASLAEQRQATLYANLQIGAEVYLRGFLQKGYSDGSPDTGYGLSIASAF